MKCIDSVQIGLFACPFILYSETLLMDLLGSRAKKASLVYLEEEVAVDLGHQSAPSDEGVLHLEPIDFE